MFSADFYYSIVESMLVAQGFDVKFVHEFTHDAEVRKWIDQTSLGLLNGGKLPDPEKFGKMLEEYMKRKERVRNAP